MSKDIVKCIYCKKKNVCKHFIGWSFDFPAKKKLTDDNNYMTHRWNDAKYCSEYENWECRANGCENRVCEPDILCEDCRALRMEGEVYDN